MVILKQGNKNLKISWFNPVRKKEIKNRSKVIGNCTEMQKDTSTLVMEKELSKNFTFMS